MVTVIGSSVDPRPLPLRPLLNSDSRSSRHRAGCCPVGVGQAADANSGTPAELHRHGPSATVSGLRTRNRPSTLVVVAEYQDVRLGGSGGSNPARRVWT